MKITCRCIAEVKERAGTGLIEAFLEEGRNAVSVLEGLQAAERSLGRGKHIIFAQAADESQQRLVKNLLVFIREESGGLKRVFDLHEFFDPRKEELVLSSLMSGG